MPQDFPRSGDAFTGPGAKRRLYENVKNWNIKRFSFINVEKAETQGRILGLDEDGAAGTTASAPDTDL